jgi:hypothetical protein
MTTSTMRFERTHAVCGGAFAVVGLSPLWTFSQYAFARAKAAARDDRGLSLTTEQMVWMGIAIGTIAIGAIVAIGLRAKANDVSTEIQGTPSGLP